MTQEEITSLLDEADEYLKSGDHMKAEKLAGVVLSHGDKSPLEALDARALCIMGECSRVSGRYLDGFSYYEKALNLAVSLSSHSLQGRALNGTATLHAYKGDYDTALATLKQALPIAEAAGAKDIFANILNNIGTVYNQFGEYSKALEFFQRVLSIYYKIGDKSKVAMCLNNIGSIYSQIADYAQGLDYYSRALILLHDAGAETRMALLGNIGSVYESLSDYSRALDYKSRALALAEEIDHKKGVALFLGNIGNTNFSLADYSQALEYSNRSLELSFRIGDLSQVGYAMHSIAMSHEKLGNHDAAYQGLIETLRHRREVLKSNEDVANTLLGLGQVLLAQGKPEEGLARMEEALHLADEVGEKSVSSDAHKELADVYTKQGDAAKALDHLQKHYALKEEILSKESRKKIEAFNFRVAIAEKEHEKEVQRLKAEHYEQQLANSTLQLVAQTELLSELRDGLMQVIKKFPMSDGAAKELRERLKTLPCKAVDWEKFDMQFKSAHPEFTKKLIEKHPELTATESRICSLVRMNLKSEDIARLLCLTDRTIESHRYNIRRKLKLKKEESLPLVLAKL